MCIRDRCRSVSYILSFMEILLLRMFSAVTSWFYLAFSICERFQTTECHAARTRATNGANYHAKSQTGDTEYGGVTSSSWLDKMPILSNVTFSKISKMPALNGCQECEITLDNHAPLEAVLSVVFKYSLMIGRLKIRHCLWWHLNPPAPKSSWCEIQSRFFRFYFTDRQYENSTRQKLRSHPLRSADPRVRIPRSAVIVQ